MSDPKVTVLMAVRNGLPYLVEAIDSILRQTLVDFEFLIVDDCSSDGSTDLLKSYIDSRMRIIANSKHQGLSRSLNKGLDSSRGKYIARMDHDDISFSARLAKQSAYLDAHPEVDVVGGWARTLGGKKEYTWKYPLSHDEICSDFLFNSSLIHSSVMLRKITFDQLGLRYDPKTSRAQDYELWTRAAGKVRFANFGKVLLRYRIHGEQVGEKFGEEQQAVAAIVRARELKGLRLRPNKIELHLHNNAGNWKFPASRAGLQELESWFLKLRAENSKFKRYYEHAFDQTLENRWWAACRANALLGMEAWDLYSGSPLAQFSARGILEKAKFWIKCLIREWRFHRPRNSET